jgi:hypothetical protein
MTKRHTSLNFCYHFVIKGLALVRKYDRHALRVESVELGSSGHPKTGEGGLGLYERRPRTW